jgi:hypothetical protein
MGVPDHLLVHTVTVVDPAEVTDAYNDTTYDYGPAATRTTVKAWLQQDQRTEPARDGRDPLEERWLLVTNHSPISGLSRIEWPGHPAGAVTFQVDGPTEPAYTPAGFHHTEATLRIVEG